MRRSARADPGDQRPPRRREPIPTGEIVLLADQDRSLWDARRDRRGRSIGRLGAPPWATGRIPDPGRHRLPARRRTVVRRNRLATDRRAVPAAGEPVADTGRASQPRGRGGRGRRARRRTGPARRAGRRPRRAMAPVLVDASRLPTPPWPLQGRRRRRIVTRSTARATIAIAASWSAAWPRSTTPTRNGIESTAQVGRSDADDWAWS